jgi:hypothetical protein
MLVVFIEYLLVFVYWRMGYPYSIPLDWFRLCPFPSWLGLLDLAPSQLVGVWGIADLPVVVVQQPLIVINVQ